MVIIKNDRPTKQKVSKKVNIKINLDEKNKSKN